MVVQQVEDFPLFVGQLLGLLVQFRPFGKRSWIVGTVRFFQNTCILACPTVVRGVVAALATGAVVVPSQIEQFSADLRGCQAEKAANIRAVSRHQATSTVARWRFEERHPSVPNGGHLGNRASSLRASNLRRSKA